jgi:electron transfer flavoprotein beta subunit
MKKIAVCYKWVLSDADIRVNEKSRELDLEKCRSQINDYDRMGIAIGVQLREIAGCELVGVTCGTTTEASVRDALSRGPDSVYYLDDAVMAKADSSVTAKVLAGMIRSVGDVDVVICSEGSSDQYARQVGPRLAALLGFTSVSYVSKASFDGEALTLERKLEDDVECVTLAGQVVISVVPDICEAPIPSVKQILAAKKKSGYTTDAFRYRAVFR